MLLTVQRPFALSGILCVQMPASCRTGGRFALSESVSAGCCRNVCCFSPLQCHKATLNWLRANKSNFPQVSLFSHTRTLDNLTPFITFQAMSTVPKFSFPVHGVLCSIFHPSPLKCLFCFKEKRRKWTVFAHYSRTSLAHPRDLNPDRDYFHVIGAHVAPISI